MKIRYKTIAGTLEETEIQKPQNLRDGSENCLHDYVSDCLDDAGIKYKWFRILK